MQKLEVATVAPSLGGVETLVTLPAATSHAALGLAGRQVPPPPSPSFLPPASCLLPLFAKGGKLGHVGMFSQWLLALIWATSDPPVHPVRLMRRSAGETACSETCTRQLAASTALAALAFANGAVEPQSLTTVLLRVLALFPL